VPTPQPAIFAIGTSDHVYLEFDALPGVQPQTLVEAVTRLEEPHSSIGGVNLVSGFRPELWERVAPGEAPSDAAGFTDDVIGPDGFRMPATQHDVWLWVTGSAHDLVFDVARDVVAALAPVAELSDEVVGWAYHHNRDLTGFEDGTENPNLLEAPGIALVPSGPGAASSIVLVQKWCHDSGAWNALGVEGQELAMGRTRAESIELPDDVKPESSHVSRTTVEEGGDELDIFRRNTPYGSILDHGTYFVGFSRDRYRLHRMLERMAGVGDGIRDQLTHYTAALSGGYYTVPSTESLQRFAAPQDAD
jgi:putative iron-dependent peroxidase